ncbi:SRPBCC domain-containing protein [Sphaerisporangium corydalis]|uniref:SRPBCC domain-containing protein n=1 Tax=Sphaerisporangium corydalis TaxID=1441875 RepID=A0ABV9ER12_9ACTN|nr:SRPBCC domain-containing protein [Sphaerisporangium corydalis]
MSDRINPTVITAPSGSPFIEIVREFDAPPAKVFRAMTDPGLVPQWLGPREVEMDLLEYDARPGGAYRYIHRSPDGGEYGFRGVFHTVAAGARIIQTFEYEGSPGVVSLESTTFEDLGGRTRVHGHTVYPSVEARDAMLASGMEHGLNDSMDRLSEVLAAGGETQRSGQVFVDITMSLDGYVTAAGAGPDAGLGVGGEPLHEWVFSGEDPRNAEILEASYARSGAVIMGRNLFDVVDGPNGWNDELGYGAERDQSDAPPIFVLTHSVPEKVRLTGRFAFVTDGPHSALAQARAAAGGRDVVVMGGGNVAHEFLEAGLADVLLIHLAPMVLGEGTRLFPAAASAAVRLELLESVSTSAAQHLTYRVIKEGTRT